MTFHLKGTTFQQPVSQVGRGKNRCEQTALPLGSSHVVAQGTWQTQAWRVMGLEALPHPGLHYSTAFSHRVWKIGARVILTEKLQIIITNLLFR